MAHYLFIKHFANIHELIIVLKKLKVFVERNKVLRDLK